MADFHVGQHVWADFGEGKVLAHLLDHGHKADNNETKYSVQNPDTGKGEDLGYREPEDRDEAGSGRTFWSL